MKFMDDEYDEYDDDAEFEDEGEVNKNKSIGKGKYIKIAVIMIVAFLIVFLVIFLINKANKRGENSSNNQTEVNEKVDFKLQGKEEYNILQGKEFEDPGYIATSDVKGNLSEFVTVDSDLDINTPGEYTIIYTINYKKFYSSLERKVKVIEGLTLKLNGDETLYLIQNEQYKELGARATEGSNQNISQNITIQSNVDTSKPGNYEVIYSVKGSSGTEKTVTRKVIVLQFDIKARVDNRNYTSGPVGINISINATDFDKLVLPNGQEVKEQYYTYKAYKNGKYEFKAYNTHGKGHKIVVTINNIR